jgi:serine/threonine protein kinase
MGNVSNRQSNSSSATLEDFELLFLVGKGAFGKVWKVKKKDSGKIYAMKVLKKIEVLEQNLVEHTNLERDIMAVFGTHPFIINLHYAFQTQDRLHFVLDYLPGGSLFYHLSRHEGPFPESVVVFYAAEIILGLETLHKANIVYRFDSKCSILSFFKESSGD